MLLEVLLSVVILAVSLTLIIQSMTTSAKAMISGTGFTQAILLAENKMFEFAWMMIAGIGIMLAVLYWIDHRKKHTH